MRAGTGGQTMSVLIKGKDILQRAIETYSSESQVRMMFEEMAELQKHFVKTDAENTT